MIDRLYHLGVLMNRAFLILLMLFFLLPGCKESKPGANQPGPSKEPPTVQVAPAIQRTVPVYGDYVATVDPTTGAEIVDIRARVDAFLMEQHFKEGEPVEKNQILFILDNKPYLAQLKSGQAALDKGKADLTLAKDNVTVLKAKADLEASKAQLALADITMKRYKPLAEKKAIPEQDYDNAVANYKVAKANVAVAEVNLKNTILQQKVNIEQAQAEIEAAVAQIDTAKINLSYCVIRSPISGIAGKRLVSPGNLVGHGEATLLTTITNLDPLRVNFNISETDYLRIFKEGQKRREPGELPKLQLILADGSIYEYPGRIAIAEPTIDSKTGTLNVVGEFINPHRLLRPGMFGRIKVPIDRIVNAVLIPQEAVMVIQNSKTVYVVNEKNMVALRTIDQGDKIGTDIIVKRGVKAGELVIVQGQLKAREGSEVHPVRNPITPGKETPEEPSSEKGEK